MTAIDMEKMKTPLSVLIALFISCMTDAGATSQIDALRSRIGLIDNAILVQGRHQIYIIGEITPGLALSFKDAADKAPDLDTVILDSPGGNVSSAIDMASLIYRRKLNVVVDGRCFSACANYLFPAGNAKSVRPHSFLGIHNLTYSYLDNGTLKRTARPDDIMAAGTDGTKESARIITQLREKEARFLALVNYSSSLDRAFSTYLRHRERAAATPSIAGLAASCPQINLWVLRRDQVESIGLKNIREFWEPRTSEEQKLLQIYFKFPAAETFFGGASELTHLCTGPSRQVLSSLQVR